MLGLGRYAVGDMGYTLWGDYFYDPSTTKLPVFSHACTEGQRQFSPYYADLVSMQLRAACPSACFKGLCHFLRHTLPQLGRFVESFNEGYVDCCFRPWFYGWWLIIFLWVRIMVIGDKIEV